MSELKFIEGKNSKDALDISVMHRNYDGWIKSELDRGLKGLIAEGKTCGRIEIREPSCLPYESKHAFHDLCVACFKQWGYMVAEELSKDPPVFILSWDTRKPDRTPSVKQVPTLAWWYAIGFVSVGIWELGRWLGNVLWRLWP